MLRLNIVKPRNQFQGRVMTTKKTKKVSKIKKSSAKKKTTRDFEDLVGKEMYSAWILMLQSLVPGGRTHRLSTLVAGMLSYASKQSYYEGNRIGDIFELDGEDYEEFEKQMKPVVEQLFKDAKVPFKRKSSRGEAYSIAEQSIHEYLNWENMPWE